MKQKQNNFNNYNNTTTKKPNMGNNFGKPNYGNDANLSNQGKENQTELQVEEEYFARHNQIEAKLSLYKKAKIWLSSYKNISIFFLVVSYIVPIFILFITLFIETAFVDLVNYINHADLFASPITPQEAFQLMASVLGVYLYVVCSGWIIDIMSVGFFGVKEQYQIFYNYFAPDNEPQNAVFFTLCVITLIHFIFNFLFWLILSKAVIPKHLWLGNSDNIEFYSRELQKAIAVSTNLRDGGLKEQGMKDVDMFEGKLVEELKKTKGKDGQVPFEKLIQILPAYKIALINKNSILGNKIASVANDKWKKHVKKQTTIENCIELYGFFFEYQFSKPQQEIVKGLNWLYNIKEVFPDTPETEKALFDKINNDPKFNEQYVLYMMQTLMIVKYFKNYPMYSIIRYLKDKNVIFSNTETLIITNSRKILDNQLNNPSQIIDLSLDLTLPNIKNKEVKKQLIKSYSEFINTNNKEIALLENEAEDEVLWEPDTRFKILMKDYKEKYLKILTFFIKTTFENYNYEMSENFEENVKSVFYDFFDINETDNPLVQISKFKVIKLEYFYDMLEWVMKMETIYGVTISPLYKEYFEKLKIKEILYNETKQKE